MLYEFECRLIYIFDTSKQNNIFIFVNICSSKVQNLLKRLWATKIERKNTLYMFVYLQQVSSDDNKCIVIPEHSKEGSGIFYLSHCVVPIVRHSVRQSHFFFLTLLFYCTNSTYLLTLRIWLFGVVSICNYILEINLKIY